MKDFSKLVTEKIKTQCISPTPKWHFFLKNITVWVSFGMAFLSGAISFGILLETFKNGSCQFLLHSDSPIEELLLEVLPVLWISCLLVFLAIAIWGAKHTEKGYKWTWKKMLLWNIAGSLVFGAAFSALGFTNTIDVFIKNISEKHETVGERHERIWTRDGKSRIGGIIIDMPRKTLWIVDDFRQPINWTVDVSDAKIMNVTEAKNGMAIGAWGEKTAENFLKAKGVVPLNQVLKMRKKLGRKIPHLSHEQKMKLREKFENSHPHLKDFMRKKFKEENHR